MSCCGEQALIGELEAGGSCLGPSTYQHDPGHVSSLLRPQFTCSTKGPQWPCPSFPGRL